MVQALLGQKAAVASCLPAVGSAPDKQARRSRSCDRAGALAAGRAALARDDLQHCGASGDLAVLLCWLCDSDPIAPLSVGDPPLTQRR